ncbi:hypothetical protein ACFL2H_11500 [Planctomycetota bacterium]
MNLQHVNIKIFIDGDLTIQIEDLVKVFHKWVSEQSMPEMMIDVADYMHVPNGPGIVLVGHEADYSLDYTGGKIGLRYNDKATREGSNQEQLQHAFDNALSCCKRLESELPGLKFDRSQLEITVNDRAIAANTPETKSELSGDFEAFAKSIGGGANLDFESDPRRLFGATVKLSNAFADA